ncbi:MAG TPA: allophanate hydrolase subunit 1 [Nocardioides sp.]
MRALRFGPDAVLVEVADTATALDIALWSRERIAALDIVPAAGTVLFDGVADIDTVLATLQEWRPGGGGVEGDLVEVPTTYDGPDLAEVARTWGIEADDLVERHCSTEHVVAFCGFSPGFPYLTNTLGLPPVPRRSSPRARVEPGSVGLAGEWTGIYPTASPGGWQLIGRTTVQLFDPSAQQPALLPPGTRVRFTRA